MPKSVILKMTRLLIATLFMVLISCNAQTCPGGKATSKECTTHGCNNREVCYRDLEGADNGKAFCCDVESLKKFCPETGLTTFHTGSSGNFNHKDNDVVDKTLYYVNPTTKIACPFPYSFVTMSFIKQLPVGFDAAKGGVAKTCKLNQDCGSGAYCAPSVNPSYGSPGSNLSIALDQTAGEGQPLYFCYPTPPVAPNVNIILRPDNNGFSFCDDHKNCGSQENICFQPKGILTSPRGNKLKGFCAHISICGNDSVSTLGMITTQKLFCEKSEDCQGVPKYGDEKHNHKCTAFDADSTKGKLCCFESTQTCKFGVAATPPRKCSTTADCNKSGNRTNLKWTSWCDATNKLCCVDHVNNELWQCPDRATPLFNEPSCRNSKTSEEFSGICDYDRKAMCRNGHCCPHLTIKDGKAELAETPYITAYPCNPERALPDSFIFSFCNAETKTVVVMGLQHTTGEKVVKSSDAKKCTVNSDCSADGSLVCVREVKEQNGCYYNPLIPQRAKVSEAWKYVLIISLICSFVFALTAIMCMVCYRSKSVFDVRKKSKKKKGKKTEKSEKTEATGGDTETSKTSQSQMA